MSAAQLSERTRSLVLQAIKDNIDAELAVIRTDRDDPTVNTNPPRSYFNFDGALTYQCPAVFVVVEDFTLLDEQGPNFVNATVKVNVTVVTEGQAEANGNVGGLTIQCERYQAALFKILQWTEYVDNADNVKMFSRVKRCFFSPTYTKKATPQGVMGNFRKEVCLELEVKHWENPTS